MLHCAQEPAPFQPELEHVKNARIHLADGAQCLGLASRSSQCGERQNHQRWSKWPHSTRGIPLPKASPTSVVFPSPTQMENLWLTSFLIYKPGPRWRPCPPLQIEWSLNPAMEDEPSCGLSINSIHPPKSLRSSDLPW